MGNESDPEDDQEPEDNDEPYDPADNDCPVCGGSGGGPDAALKCPCCGGSGLRKNTKRHYGGEDLYDY